MKTSKVEIIEITKLGIVRTSFRQFIVLQPLWGIILFLFLLCSCKKDWLNHKPNQSLATPSSLNDLQAMLDNSDFMNKNSPATGEVASDGHYVTDLSYRNSLSKEEKNAYTWSKEFVYVNDVNWNSRYRGILYCNVVLESLESIKANNSIERKIWNSIKGQALFQRSRMFYELSQIWAPPFDSLTAAEDLSIPLKTEADINVPIVRSTNKDVYNQIFNDLLAARSLLTNDEQYKTRPTKNAADALLARIYISIGDYIRAKKYADSALEVNNYLMDYASDPAINRITTGFTMSRFNKEVVFHSTLGNPPSLTTSLLIDTGFYSTYAADDLRRTLFFKMNSNSTVSYRGSYDGTSIPFNGLSNNEMYLIRAECNARMGNLNLAMDDLNLLLRKRWKNVNGNTTYIDQVASDELGAIKLILTERKKELLMRGIEWSDIRRLNKDQRFIRTISRKVDGKEYLLIPNSYQYTFPIPDDIVQQLNIQQNPGWN